MFEATEEEAFAVKLVKRVSLGFTDSKSDKVYEVDLCDVGGQYVVNFRYGKRGGNLKEGTKTSSPVALDKAEKVFDKLVLSKTKKGYVEESKGSQKSAPTAKKKASSKGSSKSREQAIIGRLEMGDLKAKDWPLERVIWRAGVLKLRNAEEALLELLELQGLPPRTRYSVVWALGRCGGAAAKKALTTFHARQKEGSFLERISKEARAVLTPEKEQQAFRDKSIDTLPKDLQELARSGPKSKLIAAVKKYHPIPKKKSQLELSAIDTLYHVNNKYCRAAVLDFVQKANIHAPQFRIFRHLWKIAEFRLDAEMLAELHHRFERSRPMYRSNSWYASAQTEKGYKWFNRQDLLKEKKSKKPLIAFNDRTQSYFKLRLRRQLRKLREIEDPVYIDLATAILLTYKDEDAKAAKTVVHYSWNTGSTTKRYDRYAGNLLLNDILYGQSPRYEARANNKAYLCKGSYKPGEPAPELREEAMPELWDKAPEALLTLISKSRCDIVQAFACKALKANESFLKSLTLKQALAFIQAPYDDTVSFGLSVLKKIYKNKKPDKDILLCLANSSLDEARAQGLKWIKAARDFVLADQDMLLQLLSSPREESRSCAINLVKSASWSEKACASFVGQVLSLLNGLGENSGAVATDLGRLLTTCFESQLESLSESVFSDLLDHKEDAVQKLAADLMLTSKSRLPGSAVFQKMIVSKHESIRAAAIGMFGRFDEAILLGRVPLLLNLTLHQWADVRLAARPLIVKLAKKNKDFHSELSETLLTVLIANRAAEPIAEFALELLTNELKKSLAKIEPKRVWRLLRSKSAHAQDLGGRLLASHVSPKDLSVAEIVALTKHEVQSIRKAAMQMLEASTKRAKDTMFDTIQVLYSDWDDARSFGFKYIEKNFNQEQLTPEILVHLCDSVREDIQRFGQTMITKYFEDEQGPEYLVKLSEHPSPGVQLFVTNLLDRFAAGKLDKLKVLLPYCKRILCLVNRGRTAKQRVLSFLGDEAIKSEDAAREIAKLLDVMSATIAVEVKAATLDIMVKIKLKYPEIPLPIQLKTVPVRAVAEG